MSEWDKAAAETEEGTSDAAPEIDWPKLQSIAATSGGIVLAFVLAVIVAGTTDLPSVAYNSLPDTLQDAIPSKAHLGIQKDTGQLDVGAAVQSVLVSVSTDVMAC